MATTSDFRYAVIGAAGETKGSELRLVQHASKKGFPRCIQCQRVIPPSFRRNAIQHNRPALFCKGACKQSFAVAVARQVTKAVESWNEPPERGRASRGRHVGELKPGWIVKRLGKKYEVMEYPRHVQGRQVMLEVKIVGGKRDGEEETLDLDSDARFQVVASPP